MSEPNAPENTEANPAAVPGEQPNAQPSQPAEPAKPERPEWAPEKFFDSETGQVRVEDMAKSYAGLESLLGKRVDQLDDEQRAVLFDTIPDKVLEAAREKLKGDESFANELLEQHKPQPPETYEVPADILPEGVEGIDQEHPLYQGAVEFAKERGLDQAGFQKLVEMGIGLMPDARPLESRMKEAGDNFELRARETMTAARNVLGEEQREALEALESRLYEPSEFEAYAALVQAATRETAPQPASSQPAPQITEAQWKQRFKDPRYRNDPSFREETERLGQQLFDRGSTL
jgi:hypothetical protein